EHYQFSAFNMPVMGSVIVWDLETVPDLKGFAAANAHGGKTDDEIREAMGDKFPKHIYHSIVFICALIAHQDGGGWTVDALGAPHVGELLATLLYARAQARLSPDIGATKQEGP